MSEQVEVPFDDKSADNATLLLAAAEDLGLDAEVVRTTAGSFVVPQEVHDKAFPPKKKARGKAKEPAEGEENKES